MHVIFCDESTVSNRNYAPVRVIRPPGSRDDPKYTLPAFAQSRISVNVWGGLSYGKKWPLVRIREEIRRREPDLPQDGNHNLTGERYAECILFNHLSRYAADLAADGRVGWTVEDNVKLHHTPACRAVRDLCGFQCLDHPPASPDLNPIEHLWAHIKIRLSKRRTPTSADALWDAIVDIYENETPQELLNTLVESMGARIETCIKFEGKYTGY
jgi:hypothetical protein